MNDYIHTIIDRHMIAASKCWGGLGSFERARLVAAKGYGFANGKRRYIVRMAIDTVFHLDAAERLRKLFEVPGISCIQFGQGFVWSYSVGATDKVYPTPMCFGELKDVEVELP